MLPPSPNNWLPENHRCRRRRSLLPGTSAHHRNGSQKTSALRTQIPEIPAREMTGVSHWLMMDKPAEFNALLDAFLAGVR